MEGLHIRYEHPTRLRTLSKVSCGGGGGGLSKGILDHMLGYGYTHQTKIGFQKVAGKIF